MRQLTDVHLAGQLAGNGLAQGLGEGEGTAGQGPGVSEGLAGPAPEENMQRAASHLQHHGQHVVLGGRAAGMPLLGADGNVFPIVCDS